MKKQTNKLVIIIVVVLVIIAIIGGATYAYWSWQTSTEQQTNVSVTVVGGELNITGDNITSASIKPTVDCDGESALIGEATVTAENETTTDMTVTLKLRGTLSATQGNLTETNKGYLKWAIIETTNGDATDNACENPEYSGTLSTVSSNTDFNTGITFTAPRSNLTESELTSYPETTISNGISTTTRKYKVYVWLDSEYSHINTGNTVSDPMQDLTLSVKWSPASTMAQG